MPTEFTDDDFAICKKFLEDILSTENDAEKSMLRPYCFCLTKEEIKGEVIDVLNRYLSDISCPRILLPHLIYQTKKKFLDEELQPFELKKNDSDVIEYDASALMKTLQSYFLDTCSEISSNLDKLNLTKSSQNIHVSLHAVKNKRRKMEDRHMYFENINALFPSENFCCDQSIYGVFDGHGGTDAANYVASHLLCNLTSYDNLIAEPGDALTKAILRTDECFLEKGKRERLRSGSTAVIVLIQNANLTVCWLGDSQVVLCKAGNAIQLMEPHKPDREDERERIEALGGCVVFFGGWRVNGSLSVSRAIGDYEQKPYITGQPDVAEFEMEGDEEFLILACDGLWDTVDPIEAIETVKNCIKNGTRDKAAEILVELAKEQHSMDNITIMVVYLDFNSTSSSSSEQETSNKTEENKTDQMLKEQTDAAVS